MAMTKKIMNNWSIPDDSMPLFVYLRWQWRILYFQCRDFFFIQWLLFICHIHRQLMAMPNSQLFRWLFIRFVIIQWHLIHWQIASFNHPITAMAFNIRYFQWYCQISMDRWRVDMKPYFQSQMLGITSYYFVLFSIFCYLCHSDYWF